MTKRLSDLAWHQSKEIVNAIKKHPFNTELASGVLSRDKFTYYIEQDALYLRDFSRSLAMISSRVPLEFVKDFLAFAEGALLAEQEVVHSVFKKAFNLQETGKLTPTTLAYTSFLLHVCSNKSVEVAVAAILPCFWVYREVGLAIVSGAKSENPYALWIETYSGEDFGQSVLKAIRIFDRLADQASEEIKIQMLDAFYKSTVFEWHFWNDSYNQTVFDGFISNNGKATYIHTV